MFAIAEKLGVPVTELEEVDQYWIGAAQAMLEAEQMVREKRDTKKSG